MTTPKDIIGDDDFERAIEDEYARVMMKAKDLKKQEERERLIELGFGKMEEGQALSIWRGFARRHPQVHVAQCSLGDFLCLARWLWKLDTPAMTDT